MYQEVTTHPKISPLLPYYVSFVRSGIQKHGGAQTELLGRLLNFVRALFNNPYLNFSPKPYVRPFISKISKYNIDNQTQYTSVKPSSDGSTVQPDPGPTGSRSLSAERRLQQLLHLLLLLSRPPPFAAPVRVFGGAHPSGSQHPEGGARQVGHPRQPATVPNVQVGLNTSLPSSFKG